MHLQTFLSLCLAATSALALPRENVVRRRQIAPSSSTTPNTSTAFTRKPFTSATGSSAAEEICNLPFNSGDPETAKDTWERSGAAALVYNYIGEHGVDNWVEGLFGETLDGPMLCTNFPQQNTCSPPDPVDECLSYDPPGMYFVQLAVSNLYGSFFVIHEAIQDTMINDLASGIKDIVDKFGPTPPAIDIVSMLNGLFLIGSIPFDGVTSDILTGLIGVTNVVDSVVDETLPEEVGDDLEKVLGDYFENFRDALDDQVNAIFGTGFEEIGATGDTVSWVADQFADGKMLDHTIVNPLVDSWIERTVQILHGYLAIQALKAGHWFVYKGVNMAEEHCFGRVPGAKFYANDNCLAIAKLPIPITFPSDHIAQYPVGMDEDTFNALASTTYGMNYREWIINAILCDKNDGGEADFSDPQILEGPRLPPCFANFEVQEYDEGMLLKYIE